jgi:hypothetical protein
MFRRLTTAATAMGMAVAVLFIAVPAANASSVGSQSAVSVAAPGSGSAVVTPDGGGATNYCAKVKVNGQFVGWRMYYTKVSHSFQVWGSGIGRTVWCQDPNYSNYNCLAAVEGLAFALMGGGVATRAALSLVGGGTLSDAAIWTSC